MCKLILGLHLFSQLKTGLSIKNCQLFLGRVSFRKHTKFMGTSKMKNELEVWYRRFEVKLNQKETSFNTLYEMLKEMRNEKMGKEKAYEILVQLRTSNLTEGQEDMLLDLMDIVSGYCSPNVKLWE